jgi:hypothetical protein
MVTWMLLGAIIALQILTLRRSKTMPSQNVTDLQNAANDLTAGASELVSDAQAASTYVAGLQNNPDDALLPAITSQLKDALAKIGDADTTIRGILPPAPSLAVSPATVDIPVGSTSQVALAFTGGTGTITAAGLPSGVTFNGADLVPDGTQTASTETVTFTDSSTPPLSCTAALTIA